MEDKVLEQPTLLKDQKYGPLTYDNKLILAPMVRVNSLPWRLLCLKYGADIVFSEELIAYKLRNTTRIVNEKLGTVDFRLKDKDLVFQTSILDHPNVLQIGANDAVIALQAASVVSADVNGIDVNMGCPKHFSVHAGMGAGLLSKPDTIKDILTTLKRNLGNSITCKIRLLSTLPDTIDLMKMIEQTGVSAVTIHLRHIPERPKDKAHWEHAKSILSSSLNIPVVLNGDIFEREDISTLKELSNAKSFMIARGTLRNPSIFSAQTLPVSTYYSDFIKLGMQYESPLQHLKYVIAQSIGNQSKWDGQLIGKVSQSKDFPSLCSVLGLDYTAISGKPIPQMNGKSQLNNNLNNINSGKEETIQIDQSCACDPDSSENPTPPKRMKI